MCICALLYKLYAEHLAVRKNKKLKKKSWAVLLVMHVTSLIKIGIHAKDDYLAFPALLLEHAYLGSDVAPVSDFCGKWDAALWIWLYQCVRGVTVYVCQ